MSAEHNETASTSTGTDFKSLLTLPISQIRNRSRSLKNSFKKNAHKKAKSERNRSAECLADRIQSSNPSGFIKYLAGQQNKSEDVPLIKYGQQSDNDEESEHKTRSLQRKNNIQNSKSSQILKPGSQEEELQESKSFNSFINFFKIGMLSNKRRHHPKSKWHHHSTMKHREQPDSKNSIATSLTDLSNINRLNVNHDENAAQSKSFDDVHRHTLASSLKNFLTLAVVIGNNGNVSYV